MKQAVFYKKLKNKIKCTACSRYCILSENQKGVCSVRQNKNNKLYSLVYSKPIAEHIDPIEKKPFYHFLPKTFTYSIGTFGCNFRCVFCQNFEISQPQEFYPDLEKILAKIKTRTPKQIVESAIKSNCKSIAYTYNEPTVFIEYALDIARLAKSKGLKNLWVSNGFFSKEAFKELSKYIDAMNIDLKSINPEFYKKYVKAELKPVLENLKRIAKSKIHLEITTLLIPTLNDSTEEIEKMAKFIASLNPNIPWHISRFFPMYKLTKLPPTPIQTLKKAEKIAKKYLKNVYLGNI